MSDLHFIVNPIAGKGLSKKLFAIAQEHMQSKSMDYTFDVTQYPGHAIDLTKKALEQNHGCIIAVGGDGTAREVAMAMIGATVPMGILPCGTGNDLSQALNIPKDIIQALDVITKGTVCNMDAGLANDKLFFNVAGFGFDVDVILGTEKFKKRFKGLSAYTLGLLSAIFKARLYKVHIKTENEEFSSNALVVEICNGRQFGGGMKVAPFADPCDGYFDLCVISDVTRFTILRVLSRFQRGEHTQLKYCKYVKAKEITVESNPPSPLQLDGEIIESTPVTFTMLPGKLKIMGKYEPLADHIPLVGD